MWRQYVTVDTKSSIIILILFCVIITAYYIYKYPKRYISIRDSVKNSILVIILGLLILLFGGISSCIFEGGFNKETIIQYLFFNDENDFIAGFSYTTLFLGFLEALMAIKNKLKWNKVNDLNDSI